MAVREKRLREMRGREMRGREMRGRETRAVGGRATRAGEAGIALVMALLLTGLFAVLGLGLLFTVSVDRLADRNYRDEARTLHAADAALALVAAELAAVPDFDTVLAGPWTSRYVDGPPTGIRELPGGGTVDLTVATWRLRCGRVSGCSDGQVAMATAERPWGTNNPRWRPCLYIPLADVAGPVASDLYVVVWLGDDAGEGDGDPVTDGVDGPGRGVIRAHAEAFGRLGSRRAIEAELTRVCAEDGSACLPGIRVQSWREVAGRVP